MVALRVYLLRVLCEDIVGGVERGCHSGLLAFVPVLKILQGASLIIRAKLTLADR